MTDPCLRDDGFTRVTRQGNAVAITLVRSVDQALPALPDEEHIVGAAHTVFVSYGIDELLLRHVLERELFQRLDQAGALHACVRITIT